MQIEVIGILGGVAAAAACVSLVLERRMDVLYGPFIEGQASVVPPEQKLMELASSFVDRLRWRVRNMMYLTSIVSG
jgi:hypothetical protein